MSPFEKDVLLPLLRELNCRTGAISAVSLAVHVNRAERTARHYLKRMEQAGAVYRPHGPRKGWVVSDFQLRSV